MSPQRPRRKKDLEAPRRPSSKRSSSKKSSRKQSSTSAKRSKSPASNNGPLYAVIGLAAVIIALMGGYIITQSGDKPEVVSQQVVAKTPIPSAPSNPVKPKVETVDLESKPEPSKPVVPKEVEVKLTSNVYGTTFIVRDLSVELKEDDESSSKNETTTESTTSKMEESKNVVAENIGGLVSKMKNGLRKTSIPKPQEGLQIVSLTKNSLEESIQLDPKKKYSIQARLEETPSRVFEIEPLKQKQVDVEFSDFEIQKLRKSATCLILMPGGGFGSGFVFGDRQTIATAAHCVAAPKAEDLIFVFHPTERDEYRTTGAKLIYFDAKQDVAVLKLPEKLASDTPYFWSGGLAKPDDEIVILGNPGRTGKFDPTYSRRGKVKGGRTDEFFLDIEVKPGYSGGPVCRASNMDALGITSYKIIGGKFDDIGKSFAKSVGIAFDAYQHFVTLEADDQNNRINRIATRYSEVYGMTCASNAAKDMLFDSSIYAYICIQVLNDYITFVNSELSQVPSTSSLAFFNRKKRLATTEFMKKRGPELAEKVRERVTPKLRMSNTNNYDNALKDPIVPDSVKESLKKANDSFIKIQEAAENIVKPGKNTKKGRNLNDFLQWVIDTQQDASYYCTDVIQSVEPRLKN